MMPGSALTGPIGWSRVRYVTGEYRAGATRQSGADGPEESVMRSIEVEVRSESGLHARPAAAFVRAAARFASKLRLENVTLGRSSTDAKSIVGVMAAGVEQGHIVRVVADGPDEDRAVETLRDVLAGLGRPIGK
jgi:phosphotransferase system HPr (HPr) family protein